MINHIPIHRSEEATAAVTPKTTEGQEGEHGGPQEVRR